MITSEIQSVDFVKSAATRSVTRAPAPTRTWAAYPLGQVEMLEAAASVLKAVAHQHQLRRDLANDRRLVKRYELALTDRDSG
ncbi:MAG TPA: hypothetical protein VGE37_04915 [Archangium sp.]